jgi:hypothetical protein
MKKTKIVLKDESRLQAWIRSLCIVDAPPVEGKLYRWLGCYILLYGSDRQPVSAEIGINELEEDDSNLLKVELIIKEYFELRRELTRLKRSGILKGVKNASG